MYALALLCLSLLSAARPSLLNIRDECGPVAQPTGASPFYQPLNTCNNAVVEVSITSAAYGIFIDQNTDFTYVPEGPTVPDTFANDCAGLFETVCGSLPACGKGLNQWTWAAHGSCSVGYWMSDNNEAAEPPLTADCVNDIMIPMGESLKKIVSDTNVNNRASINVVNFPVFTLHESCNFEYGDSCVGNSGYMGSQVNAGYLSWIMQPTITGGT